MVIWSVNRNRFVRDGVPLQYLPLYAPVQWVRRERTGRSVANQNMRTITTSIIRSIGVSIGEGNANIGVSSCVYLFDLNFTCNMHIGMSGG
jgi:hypothetical protein